MTSPQKSDHNRLYFLDGLRGWGAFVVLLYHTFVDAFPVDQASKVVLHHFFFFNGTLAVWIFFLISGFALSAQYLSKGEMRILSKQAAGRYFRLVLPILFISFIMYVLMKLGFVLRTSERPGFAPLYMDFSPTLLSTLKFALFDVFFAYDYKSTMMPPLWTMPIEMYGSILVLGTLAASRKIKKMWLVYGALMAFTLWGNIFLTLFVIGMICCDLYTRNHILFQNRHKNRIAVAFAVLGILLAYYLPSGNQPLYLFVSTLLFLACLLLKPMQNFLQNRLSLFLGRISFTLYLVHGVVLWTFTLLTLVRFDAIDIGAKPELRFWINIATIVLSLLLSRALLFVDEYSVRISRAIGKYVTRT